MTDAGEQAFMRMRDAARRFDTRIRRGLADDDVDRLRELLALAQNIAAEIDLISAPPAALGG